MATKKEQKQLRIKRLFTTFYKCFGPQIIEDLNSNQWRASSFILFYRNSSGRWSELKPANPNLTQCFENFKKSLRKEDLEEFVSDKSLNAMSEDRYGYRAKGLDVNNLVISNKTIVYSGSEQEYGYAVRNIINILSYVIRFDRNLLNFLFDKGCDRFVRLILDNHSHYLTKKVLLNKLDKVTTDKTRKQILSKIKTTNRSAVISWVNSKGGLPNLTKGLRNHIIYDLGFESSEFKSSIEKSNLSIEDRELVKEFSESSKDVAKAMLKLSKSIEKKDSVFNDILFDVFEKMDSFNLLFDKIEKRDKAVFFEACEYAIVSFSFSNEFNFSEYDPINFIESIMYLPKKFSLFYVGRYSTINDFFSNKYSLYRRQHWKGTILRTTESQFGNLLLASSGKLF